jgi:hypothetical protein
MNIQQRLHQLEQATAPVKDLRKPLLVKFLGVQEPNDKAGILYLYGGKEATTHSLNSQQLANYEACELNNTTEQWLNTVPRPAGVV